MKRVLLCSLAAAAVLAMAVNNADAAAPKHHSKGHHYGRTLTHHHGERRVGWRHHHGWGYAHRRDCGCWPGPGAVYVGPLGPDAEWSNPRNARYGLGRRTAAPARTFADPTVVDPYPTSPADNRLVGLPTNPYPYGAPGVSAYYR